MEWYSGWCFGTMEFYDFPFSWECHHPNWRTPSFFRGVGNHTTNQSNIGGNEYHRPSPSKSIATVREDALGESVVACPEPLQITWIMTNAASISIYYHYWLVVWNIFFDFPFHIWDVILPIDELIFFKMVAGCWFPRWFHRSQIRPISIYPAWSTFT